MTAFVAGRQRGDRNRGFSLLELVIVICAIALLATLGIERLWVMRIDAERVAMEQVVGALRSALGMRVANYLAKGDLAGIRALEGSNPMDRLSEVPDNYVGTLAGPASDIAGGQWYFDSTAGALVYRVRYEDHFSGGAGSPARARFAVRLVLDEGSLAGVRLVALEPYAWTD